MKMQKVEVEVPVFYGYEFDGYRKITDHDNNESYAYIEIPGNQSRLYPAKYLIKYSGLNNKKNYFFYKKKKPRQIIYQEVREDHLKRGDFYRDDDGDVNMWISDMQSREKHPILEKIRDEFEVNNE